MDSEILPCKQFCEEFNEGCGEYLPAEMRLKCSELLSEGACKAQPGCLGELRQKGQSDLICDGVVDCDDFSDELFCPYCPEHHFHCGVGKRCIGKEKLCDGTSDCDNGADERGCREFLISVD